MPGTKAPIHKQRRKRCSGSEQPHAPGVALSWQTATPGGRYRRKSGSMVVKEHGFYKLQDDDGGVVYVPAKWLAAAVGRASIEHGKPLALSQEQNSNPADWHDKNT